MKTEDLEGKLALLKLAPEMRGDLSLFQIYKDELWAVVTGVGNEGLWIQNPAYELGIWWDQNGNLIPQEKQVKEKVKTDILILWPYIRGIMSVDDERFQKVKSERLPGFKVYK